MLVTFIVLVPFLAEESEAEESDSDDSGDEDDSTAGGASAGGLTPNTKNKKQAETLRRRSSLLKIDLSNPDAAANGRASMGHGGGGGGHKRDKSRLHSEMRSALIQDTLGKSSSRIAKTQFAGAIALASPSHPNYKAPPVSEIDLDRDAPPAKLQLGGGSRETSALDPLFVLSTPKNEFPGSNSGAPQSLS